MRVRLNLAITPLELHRRFLVYFGAVCAFSALLFLFLGWRIYHLRKAEFAFRAQSDKAASEIRLLNSERQELDAFFARPENAKLHDRAAFVNTIIDARSFNWTRMFMDLETVLPQGARVLTIEPKQLNGQVAVKMSIGVTDDQVKGKFLTAFEHSDVFSHLQLSSVRADDRQGGAGNLVLELTCIYSRA
jgi:hypothetical protein